MPKFLTREDKKNEEKKANRARILDGHYYFEIWDSGVGRREEYYFAILDDRRTYGPKTREDGKAGNRVWNFEAEDYGYGNTLEEAKREALKKINLIRTREENDYKSVSI